MMRWKQCDVTSYTTLSHTRGGKQRRKITRCCLWKMFKTSCTQQDGKVLIDFRQNMTQHIYTQLPLLYRHTHTHIHVHVHTYTHTHTHTHTYTYTHIHTPLVLHITHTHNSPPTWRVISKRFSILDLQNSTAQGGCWEKVKPRPWPRLPQPLAPPTTTPTSAPWPHLWPRLPQPPGPTHGHAYLSPLALAFSSLMTASGLRWSGLRNMTSSFSSVFLALTNDSISWETTVVT